MADKGNIRPTTAKLMTILFSSPSQPFGRILRMEIENSDWTRIDIAVAYCRMSGLSLVNDALVQFIERGGTLNIIVGIDSSNGGTSREALTRLLNYKSLAPQRVNVAICHFATEPGQPRHAFHPKIYAFHNEAQGKAIVGSHNFTRGGLQNNIEAAVMNSGLLDDSPVVRAAIQIVRDLLESGLPRCRSLTDLDAFNQLLRTRHPRRENYGTLIGSEFGQGNPGGGGNQQGEPIPGEFEDPMSGTPTPGITSFIQPGDTLTPWIEEEPPEAQQELDEAHPAIEELTVWCTEIYDHMLQRNEDGNPMGGALQLPLRGQNPYRVPQEDWESTRGEQFFRNQLIPEVWWEVDAGGAGHSIFPSHSATVHCSIHIHDQEIENLDVTFTWAPDRRADAGRTMTMRMDEDLLNLLNAIVEGAEVVSSATRGETDGYGDILTICRSGDNFHLLVSDEAPTEDELQAL